jgi:O-Antigen ligase
MDRLLVSCRSLRGMTRVIRMAALGIALAGPTALAFFAGGYFDTARLIAALVAWLLVLAAALTARRPLPGTAAGRIAVGGLALLTLWSAISFAWAPLSDPAAQALERLILYLGALIAAAAVLRGPAARSWAEPALAGGATIVVGYGVAGRLVPGLLHETASITAAGRLEQPLTYWNAMGALAAIGLVLTVRLAGSRARPAALRSGAAAASVILALGLYLSFSRGALAAFLLGAVVLVALELTVAQLWALAVALVGGGVAAALAGALADVRTLHGSISARETQGAVMLGALVLLCLLAAASQWYGIRRQTGTRARTLTRPAHAGTAVTALVVALFAALVLYAATDTGARQPATGANPARFGSLQTNRYAYWRVAIADGFAKRPLTGVGAGGFAAIWLRYRKIPERVQVAHSLYVETLAELGLVGFALLAAGFGGVAAAARRAYRLSPPVAAGPIAALVTFAAHAAVDWDWEMPALTLVAIALAGLLIAAAEREEPARVAQARAPARVEQPTVPATPA